jgi:diguanylate cyclase (GGDEF)-like protein
VLDALAVCVLRLDLEGRVLFANRAAQDFFGRDLADKREALLEVVHPDDRVAVTAASVEGLTHGDTYSADMRALLSDGEIRHVRSFTRAIAIDDAVLHFVVAFHPIDDERQGDLLRRRFEEALDDSADVVVFADPDGTVTYANRTAQSYLAGGTHIAELFDEPSREILSSEALPHAYSSGFWDGELAVAIGTEYRVPVNAALHAHTDGTGEIEYLSLVSHDIAALKSAQDSLRERATHDALTGLPNRVCFLEHLEFALRRLDREEGSVAVMFSDLDGFKAVNDGLGHEAGDELLIEVGRRMRSCLREYDVVARFGGDEFVILLTGVEDLTVAQRVADRIMASIMKPIALTGGEGHVAASIGISISNDPRTDPETILAEADAAMYRAKQLGKRRYQLFDDDLRARSRARQALLDDLDSAIERGEFTVMYTPVVDVRTAELVSLEAALSWLHRKRGTIGPAEFVPLARERGRLLQLNGALLGDVAANSSAWQRPDRDERAFTTWVTIGPQELLQGELEQAITQLTEEHCLRRARSESRCRFKCSQDTATTRHASCSRLHGWGCVSRSTTSAPTRSCPRNSNASTSTP